MRGALARAHRVTAEDTLPIPPSNVMLVLDKSGSIGPTMHYPSGIGSATNSLLPQPRRKGCVRQDAVCRVLWCRPGEPGSW